LFPAPSRRIRLIPGKNVRYVVPQRISGEQPFTLHIRVMEPMRDAEVRVGGLVFPQRVVKPSETVIIEFTEETLKRLEKKEELRVSVERRCGHGGRGA
jgi:hypothetical protein